MHAREIGKAREQPVRVEEAWRSELSLVHWMPDATRRTLRSPDGRRLQTGIVSSRLRLCKTRTHLSQAAKLLAFCLGPCTLTLCMH